MYVCCERYVLSGIGLCDELITSPEESYRLWCVVVCDLENLVNEEALAHWGLSRPKIKKRTIDSFICGFFNDIVSKANYRTSKATMIAKFKAVRRWE